MYFIVALLPYVLQFDEKFVILIKINVGVFL